jgi:KDO2-lipid IV(A) lauroyltransferase
MRLFAFRVVAWLAPKIPRRLAYALARRAGDMLFLVNRTDRAGVLANLRRITEFSRQRVAETELQRMAREVFRNFCKNIVDFFTMHDLSGEEIMKRVDAAEVAVIEKGLAQGKGIIIVTAHLGNWELSAQALIERGMKVNVVVLTQPSQELDALFQGQRASRGVKVIPMGQAARGCLRALRQGEAVAILADRDFTADRELISFFGQPARLPSGPAKLAVASGAPVAPGFCLRMPDDTFKVFCSEPLWPGKGDDAVDEMRRAIAQDLEAHIARWPTQWFLFHDFWNTERDLAISSGALKKGLRLKNQAA